MKKKLLEIITRHLAPPARLAAFLLAASAASGAWAASNGNGTLNYALTENDSVAYVYDTVVDNGVDKRIVSSAAFGAKEMTLSDSPTLKIPASDTLPAGTKIKITEVEFCRNSQSDAASEGEYVTINGITSSQRVVGAGYSSSLGIGTNGNSGSGTGVKITYTFSSPCEIVVDTSYTIGFLDSNQDAKTTVKYCYVTATGSSDVAAQSLLNLDDGSTPVLIRLKGTVDYTFNAAGGTLNLDADANWASGKKPSAVQNARINATADTALAGSLAAANIYVTGSFAVASSTANTLSGTIKGDGSLMYSGVQPTIGAGGITGLTSGDWTGTLILKDIGSLDGQGKVGVQLANLGDLGNAASKVQFTNVKAYYPNAEPSCDYTLILKDGSGATDYAWMNNNGYSNYNAGQGPIFKALEGDGTFYDDKTVNPPVKFKTAASFTGVFSISSTGHRILIGENATKPSADYYGSITIGAEATAAVKSGKTWTATNGMFVNGTLTVESGATVPTITTSDTAAYILSANATIGTVSGSKLASSLFITAGTLTVADTAITRLTIPAAVGTTYYNTGTLGLSGCTALTTLYLDLGTCKTFDMTKITLPDGCMVYANAGSVRDLSGYSISGVTYLVEETKAEYGAGSVTVENVPTGASVSVKRPDGTIVAATVDGTTATLSEDVKIGGAATAYDVDFAYTDNPLQYKTSSGATLYNVTQIESDWYNYSAADKTTGLKVNKTPYIGGISEFSSLQQKMTLAVVGQMPSVQDNAIFIHLGGSSSSNKGFLIYRLAEDDKVAVAYNVGHDVTDLTTMTVPNAATARHVYIITKVDDTTANKSVFTIYLDGIKWKTQEVSPVLSMTGGVQIGSDFQAQIRTSDQANGMRIKRVMPSGAAADTAVDTTGYVNVIRIYDRILTQAEIDQYSAHEEYPYVSPHGSSVRTFAGSEDWVEDGAADWANTYEETTTQAEAPRAGSALTVNTSVATTISANLESTVSYDSLTVNGTGATFAKVNGYGGVISVAGSSVIGAPVTINAGALVLGGPVTITEGGSVTFNYSDYEVTSADVIQLTGEMEEAESGKITITPPADQHYTYTYGYSGTQYVITPAVAVAVLNHGGTLTGYTTADAALADAVSGDTVTLQTAYLTPGTHATYAGDKAGVNVVVQGYTIAPAVADGTTTWSTSSYIWTGAGADNNWTTPANWGLASGYPNSSSAAVLFDSPATVVVNSSSDLSLSSVTVDAAVTLTGDGSHYLRASTFDGAGALTLGSNACLGSVNATTMSVPLVVSGSGDNKVKLKLFSGVQWIISSTITGSGDLYCDGTSATYTTFNFAGNTQDFEGTVTISKGGSDRSTSYISSANAGGAKSVWTFNTSSDSGSSGRSIITAASSADLADNYYFGALNGYVRLDTELVNKSFRVVIGGRSEDSTITGGSLYRAASYSADYRPIIRKVGSSRLTLNVQPSKLEIVDGKVELAAGVKTSLTFVGDSDADTVPVLVLPSGSSVDPTTKIIDSDAAIAFDSEGNDYTWTGIISASNTGGFTKKGAGTLTLSAVPAYTGPTTVSEGILLVPVGTTFGGAVTIAEGAKIQFAADPDWADGSTPTICTFTTAPSADTLDRIEITGFGGRQSATLNYDSGTGEYVATVTSPTLVWNGADGANWGDTGVWLVGETPATFMTGDKVSFPDSLFTGDTTELTVNVAADVDPSLVTIAPGTGHTYKFTGTGKVTTEDLVVAATGAGTLKLAADVFSELEIETAGMVTVAAGEGAVTLATVTSSSDSTALKVSSGSLTLTEGLGCVIQNDSTLILDGTFNLNKTITGTSANAELIIRGTIDRTQNGMLQWLNGYPGKFKLENNATLKYYFRNSGSHYQNRNMFGNGAVEFAGGTIYQVHANSPQDAEPINDVTLVDNTTTTISRQDGTAVLRFKGTFDGNGTLEGDASMVLALTDVSEFGGAVSWTHSSSSTANNIETATATSADATYNVTGAPASETQLIGLNFSGTAEMGAFNVSSANAQVGVNNANVELEIGGKANSASTLNGQFITNPLTLTKVGANSTLTLGGGFSMPSGSTIDVQAGTLTTEALTLSGQTLTVGANATATATGDLVLNGGTLNVNGTVNIGNNPLALWLKAKNDAIINLNAGGNLNICRIRADGSYTMNFDGGTLTEYGAGNGNGDVIGGTTWDTSEAHTITLNVKAGGLTVDTATATKIYPVLSGDAESIGGGLTKKGAGTLTLAEVPTFTGAITVAENGGTIVLPTGDYTLGANTIVSSRDTANGTMTLAYATTVELTVPSVANTTVEVTAGGETVTGVNGVYTVPVGVEVTVTYTGTNGNVVTAGGTITGTYNEATEVDTTGVTVASAAVWTGNGADNNWDTAGNWSPASVPTQTTPVVFPSGDWTAVITGWGTAKCASMTVTGNLTLAQSTAGVDANDAGNPYNLDLYGSVAGKGMVTLSNAGIWNGSGDTITFQPSLVVAVSSSNEDSQLCGSQVVFNGEVDIQGRLWTKTSGHVFNGATTIQWLTADNARVVFNGDVTLNDGSYVDNYGGYGWAFNDVTVTALGSNGAVFYNGNETKASVTGSGVTFAGKCVFNTWGEAVPVISAPAVLKSGATVSMMNNGTITTYSAETVNHAVAVSADGSYKVYACVIPQANAPAIDMTESSPVTVTTSGVTFAVAADSLIEGLYYRVKAVDGEGNESAVASTVKVKYTGDNVSALNFTAPLPTDGVLYYTIEASDSAE